MSKDFLFPFKELLVSSASCQSSISVYFKINIAFPVSRKKR